MKWICRLFRNYFRIKGWRYFKQTLGIPLVLTAVVAILVGPDKYWAVMGKLVDMSVNVLGVLLGFIISVFAIIASTDNALIQRIKDKKFSIKQKNNKKQEFSLYEEFLSEVMWTAVCIVFTLLFGIILNLCMDIYGSLGFPIFILLFFCLCYCVFSAVLNSLHMYVVFALQKDR